MTVHSSQVQSFQYPQEYLRHQKRLQMDFFRNQLVDEYPSSPSERCYLYRFFSDGHK